MFQVLKVKNGKWQSPSAYCPLDLFSGNMARVKIALRGLLKTPQNNLRFFKNGTAIFADDLEESSLQDQLEELTESFKPYLCEPIEDSLVDLMAGILTDPHSSSDAVARSQPVCSRSAFAQLAKTEHRNGTGPCKILDTVLQIQQWDDVGSCGILPYYHRLLDHFKQCPGDRLRWGIDTPVSHVDYTVLQTADDGSVEYALQKIRHYLVAATAKDCSIMISIKPHQTRLEASRELRFSYSIAVVDLDPKTIERVEKYVNEDQAIMDTYLTSLDKE